MAFHSSSYAETRLLQLRDGPDAILVGLNALIEPLRSESDVWIAFFGLLVIEHVITKRWHLLDIQSQQLLQERVWQAASRVSQYPSFVLNRIARVIALLGKATWPHSNPSFFANAFVLVIVLLFGVPSQEFTEWHAGRWSNRIGTSAWP